jgi:hypothetical protein
MKNQFAPCGIIAVPACITFRVTKVRNHNETILRQIKLNNIYDESFKLYNSTLRPLRFKIHAPSIRGLHVLDSTRVCSTG